MNTNTKQQEWERELDELMFNLPVNDWRVFHKDLITGEKSATLRGATIKKFISCLLSSHRAEIIKMVIGMAGTFKCHCGCDFGDGCLCKEEARGYEKALTDVLLALEK